MRSTDLGDPLEEQARAEAKAEGCRVAAERINAALKNLREAMAAPGLPAHESLAISRLMSPLIDRVSSLRASEELAAYAAEALGRATRRRTA